MTQRINQFIYSRLIATMFHDSQKRCRQHNLSVHHDVCICLTKVIFQICLFLITHADGDPLGQFAIIQEDEGEWGLIVKEPLDRETKDRYTLKVLASDGKFEAPVVVDVHVLDINDNSPLCEQVKK